MHERATYEPGGGHPEIEDLAALLDGRLSAEEAASLQAHLARCEPCLALLAETASFLSGDTEAVDVEDVEDEEAVELAAVPLPFKPRELPQPRRQRSRRWAPAAAAVAALAVATVLFRQQHGPPQVEVARLVASLAGRQAAIAGLLWGPVQRGASAGPDDHALASFQLGVEQLNLDVSLAVGDRAQATAAATRINGLLKGVSADLDTKRFFGGLPARIDRGAPLAALAEETRKARPGLEGYLAPADYDFGRWAEAGRLAAAAARPDYLTARDTRRFPGALRGRLDHDLTPKAGAALDEIAHILGDQDKGDLTAADYKALDAKFQEILESYYPV